jgi:putative peptide zinc metalloprotease protein
MIKIDIISVRQFEVNIFDTSSTRKKFVICYKKRYFEVGESVVQLVEIMKQFTSIEEIMKQFSALRKEDISEKQMESIINQCILPILESEKQPQPNPFLVKLEIVPSNVVAKISKTMQFLFNPLIISISASIAVILHIIFYSFNTTYIVLGQLDIVTLLGITLLFLISSCLHELGHASACQYYKIDHGGVGFGLYLNFPVFYTDVSNAWKLSSKKRLVVNIAGVYFQLFFLIVALTIYFIYPNSILGYLIMVININFLITLNPFFKFDGYWIISDILGVPNLRQRTQEVFVYFLKKIIKKPVEHKPYLFSMSGNKKIFMVLYSIIMNVFFLYIFGYVMPKFLYVFFITFPGLIENLVTQIAVGAMPSFGLIRQIFTQLLLFGFIIYALYRMLNPFVKKRINRQKIISNTSIT